MPQLFLGFSVLIVGDDDDGPTAGGDDAPERRDAAPKKRLTCDADAVTSHVVVRPRVGVCYQTSTRTAAGSGKSTAVDGADSEDGSRAEKRTSLIILA
ncbi:hypothetical protein GLOTRDRAFT_134639 [Gloeophyllum trabeum ATCC 11539]|uniref:Uncharacterized protein n=1 Tax=Gloeophyllum trabeum (strain ATCC 11539 / FP-39264 / Madison 617) TaxID=670483 RepID=S7PQW9_GLOTA|nr:uncharacterized protein GLOTRDRAFT_134639 [Gloeophyllum trabeum ATCC 11539]EPQ49767.1 hypothetical protein GLOTRDRAFT_134639 [Gloeophyllum trabeum ATCC 11539]